MMPVAGWRARIEGDRITVGDAGRRDAAMEDSVRTALRFGTSAGSVEERFQTAGMTIYPKSLRALMDVLSPETLTFRSDMDLNDVAISSTLTVHSNGEYVWDGRADDSGTLLGDVYSLSVSLTQASPDNLTFALVQNGELDAGKHENWHQFGNSRWLSDHWDLVVVSNARWRLSQRTEIGTLINLIFGNGSVQPAPTGESTWPSWD